MRESRFTSTSELESNKRRAAAGAADFDARPGDLSRRAMCPKEIEPVIKVSLT